MSEGLDLDKIRRSAEPGAMFGAIVVRDLVERLEQAEQDRVKLRNRLDAMRRQRDGYRNQLRKTEQQVARVRDVIKGAPTVDPLRGFAGPPDDWPDDTDFTSYGEWIMANRVREALDGDTRRLADQGLGGGQDG